MTQIPEPWWKKVPHPPLNQTLMLAVEVYHAPGQWGEKVSVGDTCTIEVVKRDVKFQLPYELPAMKETNENGEFFLRLITTRYNLKKHRIFLTVNEITTRKRSFFNLGQLVNL